MNGAVIIAAAVVVIAVQAVMQHLERKDLYNRIMSRSIDEYKRNNDRRPPPHESAHKRVLNRWKRRRE